MEMFRWRGRWIEMEDGRWKRNMLQGCVIYATATINTIYSRDIIQWHITNNSTPAFHTLLMSD